MCANVALSAPIKAEDLTDLSDVQALPCKSLLEQILPDLSRIAYVLKLLDFILPDHLYQQQQTDMTSWIINLRLSALSSRRAHAHHCLSDSKIFSVCAG